MKKFLSAIIISVCCVFAVCLAACEPVNNEVESVTITVPQTTAFTVGDSFTLEYTTLPEEAKETVEFEWSSQSSAVVSVENNTFTANTAGTVTITLKSKKYKSIYDTIDVEVLPPEGYSNYTTDEYSLVYPSAWTKTTRNGVTLWQSSGTANMNITQDKSAKQYWSYDSEKFQSALEASYRQQLYSASFNSVDIVKDTYFGTDRLTVTYEYSISNAVLGSANLYQKQVILRDGNSAYILTLTYSASGHDEAQEELLISQFVLK